MVRSILVTTAKEKATGNTVELYGPVNMLKLAKNGYEVMGSEIVKFYMDDETYIKNAERR